MKSLLKIAFAAALASIFAKAFMRRMQDRRRERAGDVPTLHGVTDAGPQRPEPLDEGDLNVAQNAPF